MKNHERRRVRDSIHSDYQYQYLLMANREDSDGGVLLLPLLYVQLTGMHSLPSQLVQGVALEESSLIDVFPVIVEERK